MRASVENFQVTREGELLPFFQTELKVGSDGEEDKILFIWPTTIVHKIDEQSPLYHISASDMLRERFEIVVILEGCLRDVLSLYARFVLGRVIRNVRFVNFRRDRVDRNDDPSQKLLSTL